MARLSVGVSADAKEASATFKELAADIKKVGTESVGVTDGVARVDAAMAKLASAPDTPGALAKAVAKARIEIEDLRVALEKTPASAKKMEAIGVALAKADAAIAKATERAGRLKDATEEVGGRMQVAAKGAEALTGSFGSLQGILGKMADSTSASSQAFASLGFKALAAGEAFDFGYEKGQKINKFLEEHGNYLAKAIDATTNWVAGLKSENEILTALPIAANATLRAKQALAAETQKTLEELQKEAGGWKDLDKVKRDALAQIDLITQRYRQVKQSGGDWRTEMEMQRGAIMSTVELLNKLGIPLAQLPWDFQKVISSVADFDAKLDEAARRAALAGDGIVGLRDVLVSITANLQDFKLSEVIDGLSK